MGVPPVLIHFSGWDFPGSWLGSSYLRCLEDTHGLRISRTQKSGEKKGIERMGMLPGSTRWNIGWWNFAAVFGVYISSNFNSIYIYIIIIYKQIYIYIHTRLSPHISLQVKLSAENQTPSDKKESISWLGVTMAIFFTHKLGLYLKFFVCNHLVFISSINEKSLTIFFHILF